MKKVLILVFLPGVLFLSTMQSNAQWMHIYSNDSLEGLDALNKDTIFTVGKNHILRTCDGGATWQNMLQSPLFYAVEVVFPNDTTGYVSGYEKIMKTTDCGLTWNPVKTDSNGNWYKRLCFPTSELGFTQSWNYNGDTIFRTTDGGENWVPIFCRQSLNDIQMTDETTGYIAGDSLFKTIDGGISWQYAPTIIGTSDDNIKALGFSDADTGLIVLWSGQLGKTNDGGNSWELIELPGPGFIYWNSFFCSVDGNHYYFSGWDPVAPLGAIYYSGDGGYNWTEQLKGVGSHYLFSRIDMINDSIGYVVNVAKGVFKTISGGFPVGIHHEKPYQDKKFIIQPNPVINNLIIHNLDSFTSAEISIFNMAGKLILKQSLTPNAETLIQFLNFPNGTYLYSIQQNSKMLESGKFLKAKTY
ncbi:MAG: YCF48-related protein [Lentimicrobiaceae bacterium]|nr:YCF48-related protein [Lentimicrobiaceae bacterium]MDD4598222.1 YCF48-related protein [Lentimicrobiaceae bacterium]